jgi:hypothetical protein
MSPLATYLGSTGMAAPLEFYVTLAAPRGAPAPQPDDTAADSTGPGVIDWALVVVLVGAAIFAICRSSRRN